MSPSVQIVRLLQRVHRKTLTVGLADFCYRPPVSNNDNAAEGTWVGCCVAVTKNYKSNVIIMNNLNAFVIVLYMAVCHLAMRSYHTQYCYNHTQVHILHYYSAKALLRITSYVLLGLVIRLSIVSTMVAVMTTI
jgi:hypothetical protein